ncbi:MAG: alcohol dehydrogenase class IV [Paraglaciecola sp.]|jgi:alcohol dehydrogenase class IV
MKPFTFSTTKSIISEIGAVKRITEICATLDISKPLIVTDQGIVNVGFIEPLNTAFKKAGKEYVCFDQVVADPPEHIVLCAVAFAREHQVDGVIGFGGGSSLDTAKLVALLANSDEQLVDIYGVEAIRGKRLPLILIPTTAGTGSEVTPISIVTTGNTTKAGVVSSVLLPDVALLDASLTLGLPAHVTAATGIDAMVHAIEAYTSAIKKNSYSDLLAKQALTLLANNIVEARQAMLLGSCLAGQAFANLALIGFISSLIKRLKLPVSLLKMGIGESDIITLAHDAMLQTGLLVNNPKPVTLENVKKIYSQAHQGTN